MIKNIIYGLLLLPALLAADPIRVLYMAQAGYSPGDIELRSREFTEVHGKAVELTFEEYDQMYTLLDQSADRFDVILVDNIWTADFAVRGLIDPVPPAIAEHIRTNAIPEIYNANSYDGQLWAVPFLANFQLLYTNLDLLNRAGYSSPPVTLEEMQMMARSAKEKELITYPIFDSLRSQEILVCELIWLSGLEAGDWYDEHGHFTVDHPELRRALNYLLELKQEGLLNPLSLESGEIFAAEVFTWGDALFSTNWTFLIGELKESTYLVASPDYFEYVVSVLPRFAASDECSTVSGFQGLSVMSGSRQKEQAWEYILYLSSPEFQRRYHDEFPVWKSLWDDATATAEDPYFQIKRQQVATVKSRPVHPDYRNISLILQKWSSRVLRQVVTVDEAILAMQMELDRLEQ